MNKKIIANKILRIVNSYMESGNKKLAANKMLKLAEKIVAFTSNKKGYGAWIDNTGKEIPVAHQDHLGTLQKEFKKRGIKTQKDTSPYLVAYDEGWTRVQWEGDNLGVRYSAQNVSEEGVSEIKSLLKDYDWNNIIMEVQGNTLGDGYIATYDSRDAMRFVNKHHANRAMVNDMKRVQMQNVVEKAVDKGKKKTKKELNENNDKAMSGAFTSAQKSEWEAYKKKYKNTKFKNVKEFFEKKRVAKGLTALNRQGYGAWIDERGEIIPVDFQEHVQTAEKVMEKRGMEFDKSNGMYDEAMKYGWVRVYWQNDTLNTRYNPKKVSLDALSEIKSLLKDYDWNSITIATNNNDDYLNTFDNREAIKFVNKHHSKRLLVDDDKKDEVQKAVEKAVNKDTDEKKVEFSDADKKEWAKYKRKYKRTKFKNIKDYFKDKKKRL